ncbi:KOW domain-containing RNA-binding protein [Konateibacter massiliensis]|uniref:KOW domain-containing RNA-binding protein n=1 Tax=Konateibacter massiliensis TaxID=2002841 RepID=UPI000C156F2E|nr:KOW domain-containing RNA-binding protein [Konateibacter massiliensis]
MERFEVGMLAASKAGHDKDGLYVIIRVEKEYVYLVNGKSRTFDNPKRKNKKHIQIVKHVDEELQKKLIENNKIQNEEVKRVIKLYCLKRINEVD